MSNALPGFPQQIYIKIEFCNKFQPTTQMEGKTDAKKQVYDVKNNFPPSRKESSFCQM